MHLLHRRYRILGIQLEYLTQGKRPAITVSSAA
jgi:hypothetical protein